jgi:hypothetical protein
MVFGMKNFDKKLEAYNPHMSICETEGIQEGINLCRMTVLFSPIVGDSLKLNN